MNGPGQQLQPPCGGSGAQALHCKVRLRAEGAPGSPSVHGGGRLGRTGDGRWVLGCFPAEKLGVEEERGDGQGRTGPLGGGD